MQKRSQASELSWHENEWTEQLKRDFTWKVTTLFVGSNSNLSAFWSVFAFNIFDFEDKCNDKRETWVARKLSTVLSLECCYLESQVRLKMTNRGWERKQLAASFSCLCHLALRYLSANMAFRFFFSPRCEGRLCQINFSSSGPRGDQKGCWSCTTGGICAYVCMYVCPF